MGDRVSNLLPWVHTHVVELQASGLAAACIILLLALVLLNRAANELNRSYIQRANSEPVFERIHVLLSAARERGEGELSEAVVLTREAANETELPREAAN
jgi:hypothetical protein